MSDSDDVESGLLDHDHTGAPDDLVINIQNAVSAGFDDNNDDDEQANSHTTPFSDVPLVSNGDGDQHTFLSTDMSYDGLVARSGVGEDLPKLGSKGVAKRLLRLGLEEKKLLGGAVVALILSSISSMAVPWYIGKLIDAVSVNGDMALLNKAVLGMFLFTTMSAFFSFLRNLAFTLAGERVVTRLRKLLFSSIMDMEIGFFDQTRTGELVNRLSSDTLYKDCQIIQNAVTVNISMALRFSGQLVAGVIFLFTISWKLTSVMLAVIPLMVCGASFYGRYVRKISKAVQDALAKSGEVASEVISSIRTVRSFSKDEDEAQQYATCVDESYRLAAKRAKARGIFSGVASELGGLAILLVLWYGGKLVIDGELSPGTLTSFIIYAVTISVALGALAELFGDFMKAIGSSEKVFQIIDRKPLIAPRGGKRLRADVKGVLEFKNVSFAYPSRPGSVVLKDFRIALRPGKVVALVGPSGGGKSTCVNLALGFYRPSSGALLFDGNDIASLDPAWYRAHIGTVSQEPTLFATTIAENIAYGTDRGASDHDIREAARVANADQFISQFKDGYRTVVGERGVKLSGGQKQRIAIARAVLRNPSLLLLDEATSALDSESEHLCRVALEKLMKGRTVLVIAHRLSTVRNADLVVVVHHGKAVESGTHDELLARDGIYKKLVARQLAVD